MDVLSPFTFSSVILIDSSTESPVHVGATENARPENARLENDRQLRKESQGLENAGLENDGPC